MYRHWKNSLNIDIPASVALMVNWFCLPKNAFFNPIPLDVTFVASDLKFGSIGVVFGPPLEYLATASTMTDDVSWAPSSHRLSPKHRKHKNLMKSHHFQKVRINNMCGFVLTKCIVYILFHFQKLYRTGTFRTTIVPWLVFVLRYNLPTAVILNGDPTICMLLYLIDMKYSPGRSGVYRTL